MEAGGVFVPALSASAQRPVPQPGDHRRASKAVLDHLIWHKHVSRTDPNIIVY